MRIAKGNEEVLPACATIDVSSEALSGSTRDPVAAVKAVLERLDSELDYTLAKIAFDRIIDPSVDANAVLAELDRMAGVAHKLAGPDADDGAKLAALQMLIYQRGPWNDHRPFSYDQNDPLGSRMKNKLLHNYLARRLGQCVSMPALFLILAERLGLDIALVSAPEHLFVRAILDGRTFNLETTSGALPARDEWLRQNFPITDRSIESGLYLRSLSKREGVATLALTVIEHLVEHARHDDVIRLCKLILSHHPREANAMVWQASTYAKLLDRFRQNHPNPFAVSPAKRAHVYLLVERNMTLFAQAERLGWVPFQ